MIAAPTEVEVRLRRLERRNTIVIVAFLAYVVASIVVMFHDAHAQRRAFWTTSLFATELHVPPPQGWQSHAVGADLAFSPDGKTISLSLSAGILQQLGGPRTSRQQAILSLDLQGTESLTFFDRGGHARLRMAVAEDGSPSITMLSAKGATTWSAEATQ